MYMLQVQRCWQTLSKCVCVRSVMYMLQIQRRWQALSRGREVLLRNFPEFLVSVWMYMLRVQWRWQAFSHGRDGGGLP